MHNIDGLRDKLNAMQTLIDKLPDSIFVKDMSGRYLIANRALADLMGLPVDEIIGKTIHECLAPEVAIQDERDNQAVLRDGQSLLNLERQVTDAEGRVRWMLVSKIPLRDEQQQMVGLMGIGHDITERKQNATKSHMLASVVESSEDAIISAGMDGIIQTWNSGAVTLYGFTPEEVLGQHFSAIVPPERLEELDEIIIRLGHGERVQHYETIHLQKDGTPIFVMMTCSPVHDSRGDIVGYSAIVHDMTGRKKLEMELEEYRWHLERLVQERTEALSSVNDTLEEEIARRVKISRELQHRIEFEQLISTLSTYFILNASEDLDPCINWALQEIGNFAKADRCCALVFTADGFSVEHIYEWRRQGIESCIPQLEHLPAHEIGDWLESVSAAPHNNTTLQTETTSIVKAPPMSSAYSVPLVYSHATLGYVVVDSTSGHSDANTQTLLRIAAEIFATSLIHRRTEQALQKSEERLRCITDNMLDLICQTDQNGVIEYASPSFWGVLGYNANDLLGQSIYQHVHPDDVRAVQEAVQTTGRVEYRYHHAEGHWLWLESLSNLLLDASGDIKSIIFASRDITERKKIERELEELNRLKTEFLSTAAHELRTPLTSIRGFSEIILTRQLDSTRQHRYLNLINEQADFLGHIIDDLLDISRLEAKRQMTLTLEPFTMAELVQKTVTPFIENSGKHTFRCENPDGLPPVLADKGRVQQVLKNLVSNAVKYSPDGGEVAVVCRVVQGFIEVSVQDHGIGMTPDQQNHLFEKFYRVNASNTSVGGTGLGLAITKLIVEMHGGLVWAVSEYGKGSTFKFTLPIAPTLVGL